MGSTTRFHQLYTALLSCAGGGTTKSNSNRYRFVPLSLCCYEFGSLDRGHGPIAELDIFPVSHHCLLVDNLDAFDVTEPSDSGFYSLFESLSNFHFLSS